ncbi:MAG TPA: MotA/TolQ/ExbB proton channel family protein [Candidatus Hydrogenedentes bacterium]|jgi:biopolymer transport protein ExbB|nr:MAG: Biopolymer transport protein ExbB [Candidatus Hydrogenedentes bacterium ADurb.Bin170]HNZ48122.1 MotA/TolQ/ExbB proton channel family protein [Candidatus Hydrogenedentota bacterium]HOD95623.1 MotA/TolQ/ExbB proton channel family protein [Candidatus Hydrogenedentota bacterium]HOH42282.1 MotA/TolQ/ExbB proton channel family protein [Candidatus Hydrogenedentota bacterium]HOM47760.1 MotA/TolQ/ExbB proton channel family protein [Candidatus Hydrogenedentota bacterium]
MDTESYFVNIIIQGGILMWPIMMCSVIGLAIVIERFFVLRRADIDTREFMDVMRQVLRQNRIREAIEICDETEAPVARILKAGILKHDRSKDDIREAIEEAGRFEIPRLERHLSALATCSTIAPLLGLLGTVQGMIKAFSQIQNKRGQVNPSDLAEGIGNALITTAAGLTVAIPILVVHNYFITRVDNMVLEMELSSSELIELLTQHHGDREI